MTQRTNLVNVLEKLSGAGFIGFDSRTLVKLPGGQKNPLQGRVFKITRNISATIHENKFVNGYQNAVRKKLIEEGKNPDFTPGPRPWGVKLENTPIVEHKGEQYLEVIINNVGEVSYELDDGTVLTKAKSGDADVLVDKDGVVQTNLTPSYSSEGQQGGVEEDNQVVIRSFKLSSITELRAYGGVFTDLYYEDTPVEFDYEVTLTIKVNVKAQNESDAIAMVRESQSLDDATVSVTKV